MSVSCKLSVTESRKPTNIFYVWYAELCRRSNSSPLTAVKPAKLKNDTVLDFTADRIKPEEWTPILNALRLDTSLHAIAIRSRIAGCKFLYEINTEERMRRMNRRFGSLWTDYIISSLSRSLGNCLKNTEVLASLELEGLPIAEHYLELLFQSLTNNRTLKVLSLKRCPINDSGCEKLCVVLRSTPNIEVLDLSGCNLTSISGDYIARIIQHQQLNRFCESWHQSLRYEEPEVINMAGLKRISLNNNPGIGDEGLGYILDQLLDDLWIKAVDMQKCNITENLTDKILTVIEKNDSLKIADFRNNDLSFATMERILDIFRRKYRLAGEPEYQWCCTTTTLSDFAISRSDITSAKAYILQKSRSEPLKQSEPMPDIMKAFVRRTNTVARLEGKSKYENGFKEVGKGQLLEAKKQFSLALNIKLHEEISKKKYSSKGNCKSSKSECIHSKSTHINVNSNCDASVEMVRLFNNLKLDTPRNTASPNKGLKKKGTKHKIKYNVTDKSQTSKKLGNKSKAVVISTKQKMYGRTPLCSARRVSQEDVLAQKIFEKILNKDYLKVNHNVPVEESDDDDYFSYYEDDDADDVPEENLFKTAKDELKEKERSIANNIPSSKEFLKNMVNENLKLRLDTQRLSDESSLNSPREKAQNCFIKMLLEAG